VAVPEQKVYGRVEGIRLHDSFRIALEESVALVSGGIAMCGRALQDKEKVQCCTGCVVLVVSVVPLRHQ
jgi:hypothetical protein